MRNSSVMWDTNMCCKDCQKRTITPNCHMTCPEYLKFKEERNRANELRRAGIKLDYDLDKIRFNRRGR